jgi:hypothetical protein
VGFFKKADPLGWVDFVKQTQSKNMQAYDFIRLWCDSVDYKIESGTLLTDYKSEFPEGMTVQGNIGNFLELLEAAKQELDRGFRSYGFPKMKLGRFDAFSIAVINQEVFHESIINLYLHKLLEVGAWIHCANHELEPTTFEPYISAKESVQVFKTGIEFEKKQYLDLFYGNDLILGPRDTSEVEILKWAEQSFGMVAPYRKIAKKKEPIISSLMPWVLGEASTPDLSTFDF